MNPPDTITRQRILLVLAVVGFVVPNAMLIAFIAEHGFDPGAYLGDWTETLPAAQLAADLVIAFVAFAIWSVWEGRRLGMRAWWVAIPASLLVGLCFAVPLFLFMRERIVGEAPA